MAERRSKVDIFMPLFIADYLADTGDLSAEEHGAYLLLMMAAWRMAGRVPADPERLARLAKISLDRWPAVWQTLARFWVDSRDGFWIQRRLLDELCKAEARKKSASVNGRKGGEAKRDASGIVAERIANELAAGVAEQEPKTTSSPSPSQSGSFSSDPSRSSPPDQTRSNPDADGPVFLPPRTRHPIARVGTLTDSFLAVFNRYPRGDKRMEAAQIFAELADDYPGGEAALSSAILAAFDAGMLKRHPYHGPNATRPCLDAVLANRRWEDPPSAPDDVEPPKPTGKPWLAADKAAERERASDRAQRRIAQQELDRQLAGEKATG